MARAQEIVLVGAAINALKNAGSSCGETHIQKSCYIAKSVEDVPFASEFILYKYGPFSFELNATLNDMRAKNVVIVTSAVMGSSFSLNQNLWNAFCRASGGLYEQNRTRIEKVCLFLAHKRVSELERIATAIYVRINFPALHSVDERKSQIIKLKPHINSVQARIALEDSLELYPEAKKA